MVHDLSNQRPEALNAAKRVDKDSHPVMHSFGGWSDRDDLDELLEENYSDHQDATRIDVVGAKHVNGYRLLIEFSDGFEQIVDFGPFLQSSSNPLIRQYLDAKRFTAFRVTCGDLEWDDYGLCFPVADLYENCI